MMPQASITTQTNSPAPYREMFYKRCRRWWEVSLNKISLKFLIASDRLSSNDGINFRLMLLSWFDVVLVYCFLVFIPILRLITRKLWCLTRLPSTERQMEQFRLKLKSFACRFDFIWEESEKKLIAGTQKNPRSLCTLVAAIQKRKGQIRPWIKNAGTLLTQPGERFIVGNFYMEKFPSRRLLSFFRLFGFIVHCSTVCSSCFDTETSKRVTYEKARNDIKLASSHNKLLQVVNAFHLRNETFPPSSSSSNPSTRPRRENWVCCGTFTKSNFAGRNSLGLFALLPSHHLEPVCVSPSRWHIYFSCLLISLVEVWRKFDASYF